MSSNNFDGVFLEDSLAPGANEIIVSYIDTAKEHNKFKCCSATNNFVEVIHSSEKLMGRLGGTAVKHLPSAQGVIPAFWD